MTSTDQTLATNGTQHTATEMFWIATVQPVQKTVGSFSLFTFKGAYTPRPGDTRRDAFNSIRAYIADQLEQAGQPSDHSVLFYSLEPNQL